MDKLYLVSQQLYDEFVIYGIFSEKELDTGLEILAKKYMEIAIKNKKGHERWYSSVHLPVFEGKCEYGCEHMPFALSVPILEYAKSRFTVTELELNVLAENGIWVC